MEDAGSEEEDDDEDHGDEDTLKEAEDSRVISPSKDATSKDKVSLGSDESSMRQPDETIHSAQHGDIHSSEVTVPNVSSEQNNPPLPLGVDQAVVVDPQSSQHSAANMLAVIPAVTADDVPNDGLSTPQVQLH